MDRAQVRTINLILLRLGRNSGVRRGEISPSGRPVHGTVLHKANEGNEDEGSASRPWLAAAIRRSIGSAASNSSNQKGASLGICTVTVCWMLRSARTPPPRCSWPPESAHTTYFQTPGGSASNSNLQRMFHLPWNC